MPDSYAPHCTSPDIQHEMENAAALPPSRPVGDGIDRTNSMRDVLLPRCIINGESGRSALRGPGQRLGRATSKGCSARCSNSHCQDDRKAPDHRMRTERSGSHDVDSKAQTGPSGATVRWIARRLAVNSSACLDNLVATIRQWEIPHLSRPTPHGGNRSMCSKGHRNPDHRICTWSTSPLGEGRRRRLVEHLVASGLLDRNGRNRSVWSEM